MNSFLSQDISTEEDKMISSLSDEGKLSAETIVLQEKAKDEDDAVEENLEYSGLVSFIKRRFEYAKTARQYDEKRWLEVYRNFRGLYGPDVQFLEHEKSRAFIKITKTKVLAAYGKLVNVLFSGNMFPIGVESTPVPEGVAEAVNFDPKKPKELSGKKEDQTSAMPSSIARQDIFESLKDKLGPYKDKLSELEESGQLEEGHGKTPTSLTWEPAKEAARLMEKQMHDQLEESNASKHLRSYLLEMCLFGSSVWKGPFARDKEYPRWDEEGNYKPIFKVIPDVTHTSIWNNYPDPGAQTKEDCEYWFERHKLNRTQVRALKKRPYFREQSIEAAIERGPNYINEYWEDLLDEGSMNDTQNDRYEVIEYWGIIDKEILEETDFEIPSDLEDLDSLQVNIWICNDQILRLIINPFTPAVIPYYVTPYEVNPYSMWGIGVAENMLDTQLLMNGFMRLAIDNATLSSNVVFEVDETNLVPGQDMSVYPGKVFRRQSGAPGQAIFATKYPNVTNECLLMFDKARQLSDESTGIPSYAHGMSGIMSTGRTASGMSMLMAAADENIKSVVKNVDDYLLVPFGQALYAFNMQFNFDPKINGDLTVVARGTERLVRNEIRSQKLLQFLQITANEMDAPFVKRDYILRELAYSLNLDAEKLVNDPREAILQAEAMKKMREALGVNLEGEMGGMPNPAALPSPIDPTGTGGGNIAPGEAPQPNEEGFSGNAIPPNLRNPVQ